MKTALQSDAFLVLSLEKLTSCQNQSFADLDALEEKKTRKKLASEFERDGQVKAERQHLLNYERPNYNI